MAEPGARAVIAAVASTFTEFTVDGAGPGGDGPLDWAGYAGSLAAARERSGEDESVVCGHGKIGGGEAGVVAVGFRLLRGPIRSRARAPVARALDRAIRLPPPGAVPVAPRCGPG